MHRRFTGNEEAVSPVVGVMLMLVVTIIIAAVVSGFAGGLAGGTKKAPQITLGAKAYANQYILIEHLGGDPLNTGAITVRTFIPSGSYKDMSHVVTDWGHQTYTPTNDNLIDELGAWVTFKPGDQIRIDWDDAFALSSYGYMAPASGESVNIEIYDATSGKLIVSTQTIVQ